MTENNSNPSVSIIKVTDETYYESVNKAIDLIGGFDALTNKKVISIKPNLSSLKSSVSGATTDLRIVESLIKRIKLVSNPLINIVESNNSHASAGKTFRILGYKDLESKYENVKCVNLSRDKKVTLSLEGELFSTILVPETLLFSDCLINVGKLKTHVDYRFTGVLKNSYGFFIKRSSERSKYHGFMHKALADLNSIYKADLYLMDGIIGMEGFGPTDGTPKPVGIVMASKDPVAIDSVAAQIIGIKPSKIKYLRYMKKKGLGTSNNVRIIGSSIKEVITPFKFIPLHLYYVSRFALWFQRLSKYSENFSKLLRLIRSALTTIDLSVLQKRLSVNMQFRLVKNILLKFDM